MVYGSLPSRVLGFHNSLDTTTTIVLLLLLLVVSGGRLAGLDVCHRQEFHRSAAGLDCDQITGRESERELSRTSRKATCYCPAAGATDDETRIKPRFPQ